MENLTFKEIQRTINDILYVDEETPLTPEQEQANLDLLAQIGDLEAEKTDAIVASIRECQGNIDAMKAESQRIADKAKAMESRLIRTKNYFRDIMDSFQLKKVQGKVYSMSIRKTPSVYIDNMEVLPKEYVKEKVEVSADKVAIKKAIDAGNIVNGASIHYSTSIVMK